MHGLQVWREKKALLEAGPEQPHAWKPYEVTPVSSSSGSMVRALSPNHLGF